jgi:uncharacterized protein (TIGR03000 family)
MIRFFAPILLLALPCLPAAEAQLFTRGPDAFRYGTYTGGHGYSYNTAYGYGLSFSPADSWWRDPFAYPAGIYPYRPYQRPITYRVFPHPITPYVSIPGPNGLPILVPQAVEIAPAPVGDFVGPGLPLTPVPTAADGRCAQIRVVAPAGAEVWVEKQKLPGTGATYKTPPLTPGKMEIYSVRAKWVTAGREVEQFRVVGVSAGDSAQVLFTAEAR